MLNSRGNFHRSTVAALATAVLVLTACTGDPVEDSSDADGSATTPSESTPTPSESTQAEPIDVNAADNLDPCTIVPRKTWLTFVPQGERDTARAQPELTDLPLGPKTMSGGFTRDGHPQYACVVTYGARDPEPAAAWGWYLGPFTAQMINKMYADLGGTEHNMGTYAAVTGGDPITTNAVGLIGVDTGFFVVVDAPLTSRSRVEMEPAEDGTGDVFVMDRRKLEVLDLMSLRAGSQPRILLPDGCPGPRDAAITSVMGKVEFARGSNDGEGEQFCLYRNPERGTVLRLQGGAGTQEGLQELLDDLAADGRDKDRFAGSSGAEGRVVTTTTGSAAGNLIDTDERRYVLADLDPEFLVDDAPPVPRKALITLLESFYASEPAATTVE